MDITYDEILAALSAASHTLDPDVMARYLAVARAGIVQWQRQIRETEMRVKAREDELARVARAA